MEYRKKIVFLFGAGAVLDWKAPTTNFLTELICKTGFEDANGKKISQKIFEYLNNENQKNLTVNFESIINFIDELFNYYAVTRNSQNKHLFKSPYFDNLFQQFLHFSASPVNDISSTYSLSIPGREFPNDKFVNKEIPPEQKYCEWLMQDLVSGIIGHISKYSYYTSSHSVINESDAINTAFIRWMEKFIDSDCILRMYTLNYDRVFKILIQNKGIDVFEGFDLTTSSTITGALIPPNLKRIVSDFDSHVFYNLHGSGYWELDDLNDNNLPGYQYYLKGVPDIGTKSAIVELEREHKILLSNIITGYQKVQKTFLAPFRKMLSAFDRDCIEADELFIIGYSFSDEHINDIIRNARKHNSQMKIVLINPFFDDEKFLFDFILHLGFQTQPPYTNDGMDILSLQFDVRIIKQEFGNYLKQFGNQKRSE